MSVTYYDIVHAVGNTFKSIPGIQQVQVLEEIEEGVGDTPLLKVYYGDSETDAVGDTDRTSFDASIRQTAITVKVEGYARPRSHIGEDLRAQLDLIDRLDARLCEQVKPPYFGLPVIQVFHWKIDRLTIQVGATPNAVLYAGCDLQIRLYVY
jgi:hypothetical protein